MEIDREEDKKIISGLYMFLSHTEPIREYLWTEFKIVVKSRLNNCGFNSWKLPIYQGLTNCQFYSLVNRTRKAFVLGNYQRRYSTLNVSSLGNSI